MAIPNPLREGSATLVGSPLPGAGVYSGDVGSFIPDTPAVLTLQDGAIANVTVVGLGDPIETAGSPHYAAFNIVGSDVLNFQQIGGARTQFGAGFAQVNIQPGAALATTLTATIDGFVTYNGPGTISDLNGTVFGGAATINPDVTGSGTIAVTIGHIDGGDIEFGGAVSSGETINIIDGHVTLDKPLQFLGGIDWSGTGDDSSSSLILKNTQADSYSYDGEKLHLYRGAADVQDVRLSDPLRAPLHVGQIGQDVGLFDSDRIIQQRPVPGTVLPVHEPLLGGPGPAPNFLVQDVNHDQATLLSGDSYNGPVAGLQHQLILDTGDDLNVVPITDNVFVHTGSGDDAINYAGTSGNNVADGGSGSNFMTSGQGNDTFFDDARGATHDIWNTIQGFHPGDASTLWGVTDANYNLDWFPNQGAANAQGITLHATSKVGGPTISVTFAGKSDMSGLSISQNPAADYTYITQT